MTRRVNWGGEVAPADRVLGRSIGHCPQAHRQMYISRASAKTNIRRYPSETHLIAYRCAECGYWHIGPLDRRAINGIPGWR